jgi:hypothetical protein
MVVETAKQERTSRAFEQAAMSNGDAATFSIGVTRRVIGPLTELAIAAAKESTRLAAELQIVGLEALTDPLHLYHRGCLETLESTQRALTLMGTSARLVTQASDRLQTAAMDTGRRIRETLESSSGMRDTTRR